MANPNPDYYATVPGFDSIEAWAKTRGMTLETALEAGVQSDDENDDLYVPLWMLRRTRIYSDWPRTGNFDAVWVDED